MPPLDEGGTRKITGDDDRTWYVYDRQFYIDGSHIWVRGVVRDFAEQSNFSFMLRLSAVGFPALAALAALGGYIITRRGFRPVRNIIDTAEDIRGCRPFQEDRSWERSEQKGRDIQAGRHIQRHVRKAGKGVRRGEAVYIRRLP